MSRWDTLPEDLQRRIKELVFRERVVTLENRLALSMTGDLET